MLLVLLPSTASPSPRLRHQTLRFTRLRVITYRAHGGESRRAYLLVPRNYDGRPVPLVISPHGRGVGARHNAWCFGDLPGIGGFARRRPPRGGGRAGVFLPWRSAAEPGPRP